MLKKKPEGKEWDEFVRQWYATNHEGKVRLAFSYGVMYATTRHWICDSGSTRKQVKLKLPKNGEYRFQKTMTSLPASWLKVATDSGMPLVIKPWMLPLRKGEIRTSWYKRIYYELLYRFCGRLF